MRCSSCPTTVDMHWAYVPHSPPNIMPIRNRLEDPCAPKTAFLTNHLTLALQKPNP